MKEIIRSPRPSTFIELNDHHYCAYCHFHNNWDEKINGILKHMLFNNLIGEFNGSLLTAINSMLKETN
jgi:hypothetical protein